MLSADVTIVGGGVIGASCAYFLTLAGFGVVLIDRSAPGQDGATAKSKGIVRVFDPIEPLGRLAACGARFYQDWIRFPSLGSPTVVEAGVIYRLSPTSLESARRLVAELSVERYPIYCCRYDDLGFGLSGCKWDAADFVVYEPRGGYGDPSLTAARFAAAAAELGALVFPHRTVNALAKKGSRWTANCSDISIESEFLLIAAGAGSSDLLKLPCYTKSIPLPVFDTQKNTLGIAIVDELVGTYIRPIGDGALAVGSQMSENGPWKMISERPTDLQTEDAKRRLEMVLEGAAATPNDEMSVVGYDLYTNDLVPIIGETVGDEGLFVATGFSGRGFKMAPAVGMAMAHLMSAKSPRAARYVFEDVDIDHFKPVAEVMVQ